MKAHGGQMEGDFTYDPVGLGSQDRTRMIKEKLPMKMIQTLSDIEYLKAINKIPIELIKEIEQDFLNLMEYHLIKCSFESLIQSYGERVQKL